MADLGFTFDATTVNPSQAYSALPISDNNGHLVVVVASEIKPTKNNDGGFIELTLEIIDGPLKGQRGPYRLNLWNQNQQAVNIAFAQFSALCHVTGCFRIQNSQQLHGIPFRALVRQQKGNPEYTEVHAVKDANGNDPGKAGAPPAPSIPTQQQQAPAGQWGTPASPGMQQAQQQALETAQQAAPWNNDPSGQQAGFSGAPVGQPVQQQQAPSQAAPWGNSGAPATPTTQPMTTAAPQGQQPPWSPGSNAAPSQAPPWK